MRPAAHVEFVRGSSRLGVVLTIGLAVAALWLIYKYAGMPTVHGRVIAFGKPVVGANVHTNRYQGGSTDDDGYYAIPFDDDDQTFLCVETGAGMSSWNDLRSPRWCRNLEFNIDLGSAGASGTVVDADSGRPIAGAVVELRGTIPGSMSINPVRRVDASGSWFIGPIVPDRYRMSVTAEDHSSFTQDLDLSDGRFAGDLVVKLDG
jgi:hypothetical protein